MGFFIRNAGKDSLWMTAEEAGAWTCRTTRFFMTTGLKMICIALELPPSEAYDLLDLAGLRLRDPETHAIYAFSIDCSTSYTLGEINWLLQQNKQKPLTKLIVPIETKGQNRRAG